nr:HD domain-containing protein [Bittarella massiliensis (ex Durand et al. 2017)]
MLACTEDSAHDREHIYRVLHLALEIAATEPGCDREVLAAACLLHDIGRPVQFADSRVDHADAGAVQAACFLRENGFPPAFAGRVGTAFAPTAFAAAPRPRAWRPRSSSMPTKSTALGPWGWPAPCSTRGRWGNPSTPCGRTATSPTGRGRRPPLFFASTAASWRGSATGSTPRAGGPWPPSAAPLPPPFTGTCWPRHAPRATARGFPLLSGKDLESAVKGSLGPVADGCVGGWWRTFPPSQTVCFARAHACSPI